MTIKITPKDVGRRVKLRNGNTKEIVNYCKNKVNYPVIEESGYSYTENGRFRDDNIEHYLDIMAFADEPKRRGRPRKDAIRVGFNKVEKEAFMRAEPTPKAAEGKTLRDEFAMASLLGLIVVQDSVMNFGLADNAMMARIAIKAYRVADAMLAAREGK